MNKKPPHYAAMIRLYAYSDTLSTKQIVELIGYGTMWKPAGMYVEYQWSWMNDPKPYVNTADALKDFVNSDFQKMKEGIDAVVKQGGRVELSLDVGIKGAYKTRIWPEITFSPETLLQLALHHVELNVVMADQLS